MKIINRTKKVLFIAAVFALCIGSFAACDSNTDKKDASSSNSGDSDKSADEKEYTPAKEIVQKIVDSIDSLPEMGYVDYSDDDAKDQFEYLCDIDFSIVKDYCIAYSKDEKSLVEEVLVIRLENEDEAKDNLSLLDDRIARRKNQFMLYKPETVPILNKAQTQYKDSYMLLIVSADSEIGSTVFNEAVK